ncbi:hemerythrin [Hydrogenivirga caldilitoris]|uniref:Hemerythrin n=1 Tax=Hydrogenivirga caldilitoris TaxID=246264 RepID=A0A497XVP6_9AQUI|nr:hemerythrin domain-containing protein [Hydrogenivirga caldilitoris]RLJ71232.1 hemerythrin [Hydrogenivirga caldilitoris]
MLIRPNEIQKVANMFFNAVHEDEIELINQLYDALKANDIEKADKLLDELIVDVEDHFSTEEAMMKEADFFGYPMHKADHDNMRKELSKVHQEWKERKEPKRVTDFLENKLVPWLKLHVAQWDSVTAMHIGD